MVATEGGNQWWPYRGARAPQLTFLEGFSSLYRVPKTRKKFDTIDLSGYEVSRRSAEIK